jgi:hypothetical protein
MSILQWLPRSRERRTRELADELRAPLEMAEADRVARGESPNDAAAGARREFGNVGLVQEISRDEWGRLGVWAERLGQDARFALRTLRRAPGFAAVAILTIALGIGATTAIFSVVDATLVHPLPYPNPGQFGNGIPCTETDTRHVTPSGSPRGDRWTPRAGPGRALRRQRRA